MGLLLPNDETTSANSSVPSNASSSKFSEMTTATTASEAYRRSVKDVVMFVSQPTEMDVLCGQDKTFSQHPGNNLYRSVIAAWAEKYGQSTNKQCKMRMTTHICKVMKMKFKSRFLKPTPVLMEHSSVRSDSSDVAAFRWAELTDQAARDKISHALRTSVTAARRRLEFRQKEKAAHQQQQNDQKKDFEEPQPKLPVDESWITPPQFPSHNIRSFESLSEAPSDVCLSDAQKSVLENFEPLPVSSPAFQCSAYFAASASQLFVDDSEEEKSVAQSLLEKQQQIFRQLKELQTSSRTKARSQRLKASAKACRFSPKQKNSSPNEKNNL